MADLIKYAVRIVTFPFAMKLIKALSKGKLKKNFVFDLEPLSHRETTVLGNDGRLKEGRGVMIEDIDKAFKNGPDLYRLTILRDTEVVPAAPKKRSTKVPTRPK